MSQENQIFNKYKDTQIEQQFALHRQQLEEMRRDQQKERKEREKERKETRKLRHLLELLTKGHLTPSTSAVLPPPVIPPEENQENGDLPNLENTQEKTDTSSRKKKLGDPSVKGKCGKVSKRSKKETDPTYVPGNESETENESNDSDSSENDDNEDDHEHGSFHSARGSSLPPVLANVTAGPLIPDLALGNVGAAGDIVYVQSLTLEVVGDKIDNLDMVNPRDECVFDFVRMQTTNGFMNHIQTNSITYDKVNNNLILILKILFTKYYKNLGLNYDLIFFVISVLSWLLHLCF